MSGLERGLVDAVRAVPDPEMPTVTIADLGILRDVRVDGSKAVVTVTPTYSGCPAIDAIRRDIVAAASAAGYPEVEVRTVLAPAWTTDWISESGRAKLAAAGIAPPAPAGGPVRVRLGMRSPQPVRCPLCGSPDTEELSRFGSTACKALWRCRSCREPFDLVKSL